MVAVSRIDKCLSDKPVGVAVMILSVLAWIVSLLMASILSAFLLGFLPSRSEPTAALNGSVPPSAFGAFGGGFPTHSSPSAGEVNATVLAYLIPTVLCALAFATGLGIAKGKRSGFGLGIVISLIVATFGAGPVAFALAIATYCVLRLAGVIGGPIQAEPAPIGGVE